MGWSLPWVGPAIAPLGLSNLGQFDNPVKSSAARTGGIKQATPATFVLQRSGRFRRLSHHQASRGTSYYLEFPACIHVYVSAPILRSGGRTRADVRLSGQVLQNSYSPSFSLYSENSRHIPLLTNMSLQLKIGPFALSNFVFFCLIPTRHVIRYLCNVMQCKTWRTSLTGSRPISMLMPVCIFCFLVLSHCDFR